MVEVVVVLVVWQQDEDLVLIQVTSPRCLKDMHVGELTPHASALPACSGGIS